MSAEFEKTVLEELKNLNNKIDSGLAKVNEKLDSEIGSLRSEMHSELNNIHSELDGIHSELDGIHSELYGIHSEIDSMHSEIKDLQHSAEITHQSLVLIEHKVTFEIPALFDGYAMSRDMQEIQHSRLNSLSFKVEDHDNRISILELKSK